ncbi:MAG: VWA domain-containing protein [Acidobacteriota bacterium]
MKRTLVGSLLCLAVAGGVLWGQSKPEPATPDRKQKRIIIDVELVNVLFSARDKKGKLVTDLREDELKIFEDDRLQEITNFSRETDLPLTIAVLIDTSSSIREKLKFEQEAAIDFFHSTIRRKTDRALLLTFDSTIDLIQDFTDDPDVLTKAVRQIKPGGGTKLYDAIYLACQEKLKGATGTRRILIVISDGDDNLSTESLTGTLEMAQRSDVAIFTISTNSSGFFGMSSPKNDKILKRIAEETGGRAFLPMKAEDLAQSFADISEELRSQYSVAYRTSNTNRDGSFRSIKLKTSRKNLRVTARKGYYAPRG